MAEIGIQADFDDAPVGPSQPPPPPPPPPAPAPPAEPVKKPPPPPISPPREPSPPPSPKKMPSPQRSRSPSPKTRSRTPSPKRSRTPSSRSKSPSPNRSRSPSPKRSRTPSTKRERTPEPKPSTSASEPATVYPTAYDEKERDSLIPRSYMDNRRSDYGDRSSSHYSDWTFPNDCSIQVVSHDLDDTHRYIHSEVIMNDHSSSMAVTLEKKPGPERFGEHRPSNYIPLTVCCVLINPLFGLMACLASIMSIREYKRGNVKEAKRHGRCAAILALVAFLVTVVILIIVLSVVLTGAVQKTVGA